MRFLSKREISAQKAGRIVISPSSTQEVRLESILRLEPLEPIKPRDSIWSDSKRVASVLNRACAETIAGFVRKRDIESGKNPNENKINRKNRKCLSLGTPWPTKLKRRCMRSRVRRSLDGCHVRGRVNVWHVRRRNDLLHRNKSFELTVLHDLVVLIE